MIIIGGTYYEKCLEPIWDQIYGSGLRAVHLLLNHDPTLEIDFYTCCDKEIYDLLCLIKGTKPKFNFNCNRIDQNHCFYYDHPLRTPSITPRLDLLNNNESQISAVGDNILVYGMLETSIKVKGRRVVYDPQSPVNPKSFTSTGSSAEELVVIINLSEAGLISGSMDIKDIVRYFFDVEECHGLIIKMGAQGALLFDAKSSDPKKIPVYQTRKVWPLGSGDVFSAFFAFAWFKGNELEQCAQNASKATALYSNTKDLSSVRNLNSFDFPSISFDEIRKHQIYLAGPFFTFIERWLINETYNAFKGMGMKVFSPYHDVGHGKAIDVVGKDIEGLNKAELVFAVLDGLDSGTLFEIGYARSKEKMVVAFVQNESEESLKMLEGTECIIEKDFTTAVYKSIWELAKR